MNTVVGASLATSNIGNMAPLGLVMLLVCCIALLVVDRKHALWPIFIMLFFVSQGQKIVVFSLDFSQMRIMVLVGLMRVLSRGELKNIKRHNIDYLSISYALLVVLFHIIRDGGSVFIYELGQLVELIVPYFVFRALIQNYEDLIAAIKKLSVLSVVVAVFFLNEHFTGRNVFSVFGGVPEFTDLRHGRLRCQGAFVHPIIAGVYFATILPLLVSLWWNKYKTLAITGGLASLVIIYACSSSTPIFGVLSSILAAILFCLREYMMIIRWTVFSLLASLHMIMIAPVWNLIARVSATGGSTSWYRYMLIDVTINHFGGWWLLGVSGSTFVNWYGTYGAVDITNQFVSVALSGGLTGFILFICIIAFAFGAVGRMWRLAQQDKAKMYLAWALGASLFAMIMSFIGVSIWGQMHLIWTMLLAMIAGMDNHYKDIFVLEKKGGDSPQLIITPLRQ